MKTNILTIACATLLFVFTNTAFVQAEELQLKASDGKIVFATFEGAVTKNGVTVENEMVILLFHQARSNRHEYDTIIEDLHRIGFDTLATDQRSGGKMWNEENKTVKNNGGSTDYASALPDLQAAVDWAVSKKYKTIVTVGSSYSSSLNFVLAQKNKKTITAFASFSPGEYLGKKYSVAKFAKGITIPVYVTSGSAKGEIKRANDILKDANIKHLVQVKPTVGVHGISTLREDRNPKGFKKNRDDFFQFIKALAVTANAK